MPLDEIGIMDCICRLSPKSSIYITLRFYNDMTYDEAAHTLKLPVSTVKYKTKKALGELKLLLEGSLHIEKNYKYPYGFPKTKILSKVRG